MCTIPTSEFNPLPSRTVVKDNSTGVVSQMQLEQKQPQFNGKSLDTLRDESPLNRLGKFEQVATAEKIVESNMKVYNKSAFATQFAKAVQTSKNKRL